MQATTLSTHGVDCSTAARSSKQGTPKVCHRPDRLAHALLPAPILLTASASLSRWSRLCASRVHSDQSGAAALSAALQHLGWTLFTSRLLSLVLHHLFTPTKLHSSHRDASCPQVRRALASGVPVPGDIAPRPRHCIGLLAVPWSRREQTRILVAPHTLAAGLSTWRTFASPVPLAVSLSWRFQLAAPLPRLAPVQRNSFRCGPRAPVTGTLLSCKVL